MRRRIRGWTKEGRRRFAILGLFLVHIVWLVLGRGLSSPWRTSVDFLARPTLKVASWWQNWRAHRQSRARDFAQAQWELDQARQRIAELQLQRQQDAQRLLEAGEAARLLGLKEALPLELRAARVVANLRKAPFGGLILEHSTGLQVDQGVICPEGVVGRIWDVGAQQASVLPLDAYNASTAVMLARSRATGILQGIGPGRAEIRYVGSQEVVQVGEQVLTSGLDRVFPRGLHVGQVTAVQPLDVELRIEVALAAPLDRLGLVFILPTAPSLEVPLPAEPPKPKGGKS